MYVLPCCLRRVTTRLWCPPRQITGEVGTVDVAAIVNWVVNTIVLMGISRFFADLVAFNFLEESEACVAPMESTRRRVGVVATFTRHGWLHAQPGTGPAKPNQPTRSRCGTHRAWPPCGFTPPSQCCDSSDTTCLHGCGCVDDPALESSASRRCGRRDDASSRCYEAASEARVQ